jgi:hypothetical protein
MKKLMLLMYKLSMQPLNRLAVLSPRFWFGTPPTNHCGQEREIDITSKILAIERTDLCCTYFDEHNQSKRKV